MSDQQRWAFGPYDFFAIDGRPHKWLNSAEGSHTFEVDGGLRVVFSDEDITALSRDPRFGFERDRNAPDRKAARDHAGVDFVGLLNEDEADKIRWKARFCDGISASIRAGGARTDASFAASIAATQRTIEDEQDGKRKPRAGEFLTDRRRAPSVRSLRRWYADYEKFGLNRIGLRERLRRSGNRSPRFQPEIRRLLAETANRYLSERRPNLAMLHGDLGREVRELNGKRAIEGLPPLAVPSSESLRRKVATIPAFTRVAVREGIQKANRRFGGVGQGLDVAYPLQRVEIDCWEVSLQTFLEDGDLWRHCTEQTRREVTVGRMVLCVAIDCATRCILGMRLSRTATTAAVLATLEMSVSSEKIRYADLGEVLTPWSMCGTPRELVADSGSEFLGAVEAVATDLRAKLVHPIAGKPEHRARIERLFGTLHTKLLPHFTGRTFQHTLALGDYPAQERASLDAEGLATVLVRYVVDCYHNEPHDGLIGETPHNAWRRLTKLYPVAPPPDMHTRRAVFGMSCGLRTVGKRGVLVLNLAYTSPELQAEWRRTGSLDVPVRVDVLDMGYVSARIGDDWHTLRCTTSGLDGVTMAEWMVAWTRLRHANSADAALSKPTVDAAIRAIQQIARDSRKRVGIHLELLDPSKVVEMERRIGIGFTLPERYADVDVAPNDDPLAGSEVVVPLDPRARDSPAPAGVGAYSSRNPRDSPAATTNRPDQPDQPPSTKRNIVTFED